MSSVFLTDLNDYIRPSQACIKPVEVAKPSFPASGSTEVHVDAGGRYVEVSLDDDGPGESVTTRQLQPISVTLNDCLACSGCITSAESVLVAQQTHHLLYEAVASKPSNPGPSIVVVSISPQSRSALALKYGRLSQLSCMRRLTTFLKRHVGVDYVFDTVLSRSLSLLETAREFAQRSREFQGDKARTSQPGEETPQRLPLLTSACPGWICYVEKTLPHMLPLVSSARSPQQVMGGLVKDYLPRKLKMDGATRIFHATIMPCYDKKLEASRPDFADERSGQREVDCVIATSELEKMLEEKGVALDELEESELDVDLSAVTLDQDGSQVLYGHEGSGAGGYLEFVLGYAARELFGLRAYRSDAKLAVKTIRNADYQEYTLTDLQDSRVLLRFAAVYGFRNLQNFVRRYRAAAHSLSAVSAPIYDFVEIMACPGACLNGGGQPKPPVHDPAHLPSLLAIYQDTASLDPEHDERARQIYKEWLDGPGTEKAARFLHTSYRAVQNDLKNPFAVQW